MKTNIGEKLLYEDVAGLMNTLSQRLAGKRGGWWARKLTRLLNGELVGQGCTDIKPIKQGIRIEGGEATSNGGHELYRQSDGQGRPIVLSHATINSELMNFQSDAYPALDCTLSEITCQGISADELIEALGDDAFIPLPNAVTFIKTSLQPKKTYIFLIKHPKGGLPFSLVVDCAFDETNEINVGVCVPTTQDHFRKSIVVHLDYLSKRNEDIMTRLDKNYGLGEPSKALQVALRIVEAEEDVAQILNSLEGVDHNEVALEMINGGYPHTVVMNLHSFEKLNHEVAQKLIEAGYLSNVTANTGSFEDPE